MNNYVELSREYRGDTHDLSHFGMLCIVDKNNNIVYSLGNIDKIVCLRSSSKPLQALATIELNLDTKYGITEQEAAIFSGSHAGEDFHVKALDSMLVKAGLSESDMIMKASYPVNSLARETHIKDGFPRRKLYHNCAGKHIASMLLQRELGGDVKDYWKQDSLAQQAIRTIICKISHACDASVAIDGCGVPVYNIPLKNMAIAFKNLACINTIKCDSLQKATQRYIPSLNKYPLMLRGNGFICSVMNMDKNIIAKGGANGIYGFGLKNQGLGVAFKLADGTEDSWPIIIMQVLKDLNALSELNKERILSLNPYNIYNDNDVLVGRREVAFAL